MRLRLHVLLVPLLPLLAGCAELGLGPQPRPATLNLPAATPPAAPATPVPDDEPRPQAAPRQPVESAPTFLAPPASPPPQAAPAQTTVPRSTFRQQQTPARPAVRRTAAQKPAAAQPAAQKTAQKTTAKPAASKPPAKPAPAPARAPSTTAPNDRAVEAPAPPAPALAAAPPPPSDIDLEKLEAKLRDTDAIGFMTKLTLKNQIDDLVADFRAYHDGDRNNQLASLRERFNLLLMKVSSLLQEKDAPLQREIAGARDSLWAMLANPQQFAARM